MDFISAWIDFFFGKNFPSVGQIAGLFPFFLLYILVTFEIVEKARAAWSWKVGYTRKAFHFSVFFMAGLIQYKMGVGGVFILGWAVTLVLIYLLYRKNQSGYYRLLARPEDEPYADRYIVYPYLATFFGGVATNIFFGSVAAVTGYLIAGFGDAVGEPAGTKWGRHRYPVFSWGSQVKSYRTLEGSIAVLIACALAFCMISYAYNTPTNWWKIITAALIAAIAEGISPHGWDNLSIQIVGALLFVYIIS